MIQEYFMNLTNQQQLVCKKLQELIVVLKDPIWTLTRWYSSSLKVSWLSKYCHSYFLNYSMINRIFPIFFLDLVFYPAINVFMFMLKLLYFFKCIFLICPIFIIFWNNFTMINFCNILKSARNIFLEKGKTKLKIESLIKK